MLKLILLLLAYVLVAAAPLYLLLSGYYSKHAARSPSKSIAVVVLGDIGRSPRMMYHAQSLAENGFRVLLVGFDGEPVLESLRDAKNVHILHITQPPRWISKLPRLLFLVVAPFKLFFGAISLWYTLTFKLPYFPKAILVQTPPALPTLPIVQLISKMTKCKLIIDWHNTAYSILGMRLGQNSKPTKLAKSLEGFFGRNAFCHLFVTQKMKETLNEYWSFIGDKQVYADHPHKLAVQRLPAPEAHDLFSRILILRHPPLRSLAAAYETSETVFTNQRSPTPAWTPTRPALLVSSTSWTADEDFSILLEALDLYEAAVEKNLSQLPKLIVLVTGKGPLQAVFQREVIMRERRWKYVRCRTAWLENEDYPLLLQAADLGVSLHSSSSGLDFPMKIVDMLGAGLRTLALDFACVSEGLDVPAEGQIFRSSEELAQQLQDELKGFPNHQSSATSAVKRETWSEAWQGTVLPIVNKCTE